MSDDLTARLMEMMKKHAPPHLELPPKVFTHMGGELVSFEDKTLVARFPVREAYENPMGMMQGGVLATLIDNTLGPLSFLVAPPSVTSTMSVTYIRPVAKGEAFVEVVGRVVDRTARQVIMEAEVRDPRGKRLATAHAISVILDPL